MKAQDWNRILPSEGKVNKALYSILYSILADLFEDAYDRQPSVIRTGCESDIYNLAIGQDIGWEDFESFFSWIWRDILSTDDDPLERVADWYVEELTDEEVWSIEASIGKHPDMPL